MLNLKSVPYDKKLHLLAGFIVGIIFTTVFGWRIGLIAGTGAGLGKEIYDYICNWLRVRQNKASNHSVDIYDFLYTAVGTMIGTGLSFILSCIISTYFKQ